MAIATTAFFPGVGTSFFFPAADKATFLPALLEADTDCFLVATVGFFIAAAAGFFIAAVARALIARARASAFFVDCVVDVFFPVGTTTFVIGGYAEEELAYLPVSGSLRECLVVRFIIVVRKGDCGGMGDYGDGGEKWWWR